MSEKLKNLFVSIDSPYILKILDVIIEEEQVVFVYEDYHGMESL